MLNTFGLIYFERKAGYPCMYKKLKLSKTNKLLFGVCGGIGEYFNIDPIIIRVCFGIFSILSGFNFLVPVAFYIFCCALIPHD